MHCGKTNLKITASMMIWMEVRFSIILLLSCCVHSIFTWDTDELELFDLVEEVGQNFYEFFGIVQDASNADVRKSYRRLSLQLHPDKNKEKDAEEKFRQLVAVYEVLKDDEKRRLYDNILLNGLPTWRQPVYYYRHVRKMSLLELAAFLFLLATGAQYLFAWSVYIEKKFELEEVLSAKFRKREKKAKKTKNAETCNSSDAILAQMELLPRPQYHDLLPFRLCNLLIHVIKSMPEYYEKCRELWMQVRLDDPNSDQEYELEGTGEPHRKPRRKKVFVVPDITTECIVESVTGPENSEPIRVESYDHTSDCKTVKHSSEVWTDEELVILTRAINKYPGGVPNRWDKIANYVGRSVTEVITAAKQLKSKTLESGVSMPATVQGITGSLEEHVQVKKKNVVYSSEIYSDQRVSEIERQNYSKHEQLSSKTTRTAVHSAEKSPMVKRTDEKTKSSGVTITTDESNAWDQIQQKALELALMQFPKGTEERWDRIAKCVPGKTKDECVHRYKGLVELVKKKRHQTAR